MPPRDPWILEGGALKAVLAVMCVVPVAPTGRLLGLAPGMSRSSEVPGVPG